MIVSANPRPTALEFELLMKATDNFLNADAFEKRDYYSSRNGTQLEDDVERALIICSKGTTFEGSIKKVSGHKFPDIVTSKYYGVEVKSTKDNHWTSTGSSIMESTRVKSVERIYMTFGKLGGDPIEFLSKPYEECLRGIAVTHMPRYLIDMQIRKGETIFDKIGIPYDRLRGMENPITPVADYYRSQLKKGESLWWTGNPVDESVSATIRLWKNLTPDEKKLHTAYGCVNFPEVFAGDYDGYALWLTSQGIVDPHIRDQFSSGGQEDMELSDGTVQRLPAVYRRVKNYKEIIIRIMHTNEKTFYSGKGTISEFDYAIRLEMWIDAVSKSSVVDYSVSLDALETLFFGKKKRLKR